MTPLPDRPTVGRLAPSPTGGLHLGHARTFLLAWLSARVGGGRVILRVEDLDATRVRPEADRGAIDDLRWLGLDWDEGPDVGGPSAPYVQSRADGRVRRAALERLKAAELVYPCTCTRADIARAASAPHAEDEGPTYPGTCSGRSRRRRRGAGRPPVRLAVPRPAGAGRLGRPVPGRGRGRPRPARRRLRRRPVGRRAVVPARRRRRRRGDGRDQVDPGRRPGPEHAPADPPLSAPWAGSRPTFGHVPLVVGPDGRRLAKRDGSIKLATLREAGVDPRRLVGWLARSLRLTDRVEPSSPADWVGRRSRRARVPAGRRSSLTASRTSTRHDG